MGLSPEQLLGVKPPAPMDRPSMSGRGLSPQDLLSFDKPMPTDMSSHVVTAHFPERYSERQQFVMRSEYWDKLHDPKLSPDQKIDYARRLMKGAKPDLLEDATRPLPFNAIPWMAAREYRQAKERLDSGKGNELDYLTVAGREELADRAENAGVMSKTVDVIASGIATSAEFVMTGGLASPRTLALGAKATRLGWGKLGMSATNAARLGTGTEALARTGLIAMGGVHHVGQDWEYRVAQGDSPGKAFIGAATAQLRETAIELFGMHALGAAGAMMGKAAGPAGDLARRGLAAAGRTLAPAGAKLGQHQAVQMVQDYVRRAWVGSAPWRTQARFAAEVAQKGYSKIVDDMLSERHMLGRYLKAGAYQGPMTEFGEERLSDLAGGLMGDGFGATGQVASGDWNGATQLMAEILAFHSPVVGGIAVGEAGSRIVKWREDRTKRNAVKFMESVINVQAAEDAGVPPDESDLVEAELVDQQPPAPQGEAPAPEEQVSPVDEQAPPAEEQAPPTGELPSEVAPSPEEQAPPNSEAPPMETAPEVEPIEPAPVAGEEVQPPAPGPEPGPAPAPKQETQERRVHVMGVPSSQYYTDFPAESAQFLETYISTGRVPSLKQLSRPGLFFESGSRAEREMWIRNMAAEYGTLPNDATILSWGKSKKAKDDKARIFAINQLRKATEESKQRQEAYNRLVQGDVTIESLAATDGYKLSEFSHAAYDAIVIGTDWNKTTSISDRKAIAEEAYRSNPLVRYLIGPDASDLRRTLEAMRDKRPNKDVNQLMAWARKMWLDSRSVQDKEAGKKPSKAEVTADVLEYLYDVAKARRWNSDSLISLIDSIQPEESTGQEMASPISDQDILSKPRSPAPADETFSVSADRHHTISEHEKFDKGLIITMLEELAEVCGAPIAIRTGRSHSLGRTALGWFHPLYWVIRMQKNNDIGTACHEMAQALDFKIFGDQYNLKKGVKFWKGMSKDMADELWKMGYELYGDRVPTGGKIVGYRREGFAEFVRMWMTQPEVLTGKAPKFQAWFEAKMQAEHPATWKKMHQIRAKIDTWRKMGDDLRTQGQVVDTGTMRYWIASNRKDFLNPAQHIQLWFERAFSIYAFEKAVNTYRRFANLGDAEGNDAAYKYLVSVRKTADGIVEGWLTKDWGVTDPHGIPYGTKSMSDIVSMGAQATGSAENFQTYLISLRTLALWGEDPWNMGIATRGALNRRTGPIEISQARRNVAKYDSQLSRQAATEFYKWHDSVLQHQADMSPIYARQVKLIRALDVGYYVPFDHVFREFDKNMKFMSGYKTLKSVAHRLKGSAREIRSIFQVSAERAVQAVAKSQERKLMDMLIHQALTVPGLGGLIEKVERPKELKYREAAKTILAKLGLVDLDDQGDIEADDDLTAYLDARGIDLDELNDEMMMFFMPADKVWGPDPVVAWTNPDNGKVEFYYVNEQIYEYFAKNPSTMAQTWMSAPYVGWIFKAMAAHKRVLTYTTTGLVASFQLVRNPVRDFPAWMVRTRGNRKALDDMAIWYASLAEGYIGSVKGTAFGRMQGIKDDAQTDWFDLYHRMGLHVTGFLREDSPALRVMIRRMHRQGHNPLFVQKPEDLIDIVASAMFGFSEGMQFPELAPRIAEMRKAAEAIGWTPRDASGNLNPLTWDVMTKIIPPARQVTIDHSQAGALAEFSNQFIPFFNATMQGQVAMYRGFRSNPEQWFRRTGVLVGLRMALWLAHKDEPWYEEMGDLKYLVYPMKVHNPVTGLDHLIMIPIDQQEGIVASAFEALANIATGQGDGEEAANFARVLASTWTPSVAPASVRLVAEQLLGKTFFGDRPIVPKHLEMAPAALQFNRHTSEVAKWLSAKAEQLFGYTVSPARAEHVVRGIFGTFSRDMAQTADLLFGLAGFSPQRAQIEAADVPILGSVLRRGGPMGTLPRSIDRLYDLDNQLKVLQNDTRRKESVDERQRRIMVDDAVNAVSALLTARDLYPDQKSKRDATDRALQIARDALARAKRPDPITNRDRLEFQNARKRSQHERKQPEAH